MKYIQEFRDPRRAEGLLHSIQQTAAALQQRADRPIKLMEVCGGHTHSIFRFGLGDLLPDNIELLHGPGCPVCVLPMGRVDDAIALAETPGIILTTFGDAIRVPGSQGTLLKAKAKGADVRTVYSPLDALQIARDHPKNEVVFLGLGFETTLPSTALTLRQARAEQITNFSVFSNHIAIIPALEALLQDPGLELDGLIGPGHVSMVIGSDSYADLVQQHGCPLVVSGFEPLDLLQSIWMLLRQLEDGRCEVENQYSRVVNEKGNPAALQAVNEVFCLRPNFAWRGLGIIPRSGFQLRDEYAAFDAEQKFVLPHSYVEDPKVCQCGDILRGAKQPWDCKVFGTACTPEHPLGPCMVSSEGACAAYYQYGRMAPSLQDQDTAPTDAATEPSTQA